MFLLLFYIYCEYLQFYKAAYNRWVSVILWNEEIALKLRLNCFFQESDMNTLLKTKHTVKHITYIEA